MVTTNKVKQLIATYDRNCYLNGSLLVSYKGEVIINQGFGHANIEHNTLNTNKTKYRIGSLTKAFTAYAIFQLQDKKKININDSINKYLINHPHGDEITIYHCLTNTSGIPNYTASQDFWSNRMRLPLTLSELIASFKDLPLNFKPGTKYEYSNSGYSILTAIIEMVSGRTYEKYMREEIFIPLGMHNTGCDNGRTIIPNMASGYSIWEDIIHAEYTDMSHPLGGYGLYSTTEDLLKWDQILKTINFSDEGLI